MKKIRKKHFSILILGVIIVCVFVSFFQNSPKKGVEYIEAQEHRNLKKVTQKIAKSKEKEREKAILEGKLDPFSLLGDFVFYGDSRVLHYCSYGFLDSSRVFADNGETFANTSKYNDRLKELNPKRVLMAYGVNDICYKVGDDEEGGYPQVVRNALEEIHEIVPKATIYVCGMIPISPYGLQRLKMVENSGEFNSVLKEIVDEYDFVEYIDDETLSVGGLADIYADDGYHFKSDFYPTWTQYLVSCMDN